VILLLSLLVIITAAAISRVWTRLKVIEYGYQITEATKRRSKLEDQNRRLEIEVALLKRPERITRLAREMGLQPVRPEQMRRLGTSASRTALARNEP
jgi:cell division protein FtsL